MKTGLHFLIIGLLIWNTFYNLFQPNSQQFSCGMGPLRREGLQAQRPPNKCVTATKAKKGRKKKKFDENSINKLKKTKTVFLKTSLHVVTFIYHQSSHQSTLVNYILSAVMTTLSYCNNRLPSSDERLVDARSFLAADQTRA